MAEAAVKDIREYRIPGRCLGIAFAAGMAGALTQGGENAAAGILPAAGFLTRLLAVMVLGFPVFRRGMIGGGDVKMAALLAAWLGFEDSMKAVTAGLITGAVLALIKMLRQGSMVKRFLYLSAYIRHSFQEKTVELYYDPKRDGTDPVIPLGACLFAGAAAVEIWQRL